MQSRKAISNIVATIVLIAIVLVAGGVTYSIMTSTVNTMSQGVRVYVETMDLRLGVEGGVLNAIFTTTLKNVGNKPITLLQTKLSDEGWYTVPNVDSLNPLEPGKSAGAIIFPPEITPGKYVVGNVYTVVIYARASDASSFSHTMSVQCLGTSVTSLGSGSSVGEIVLEGNYSSWSEITGSPLDTYPAGVRQLTEAFISESGNFGIIHDNYDYKKLLFKIKPPQVISYAADTNIPGTQARSACQSIMGKYIVSYDTETPTSLKIYKDGVLQQTISLDFSLTNGGVWISPSGKYIFAMNFADFQLHIYEGMP